MYFAVSFFFFKQKTAYEMRISDWIQTCALPIYKDDIRGLVNLAPGGYDTDEFQANIPYEVTASWTCVALNAQTTGSAQTLNVPTKNGRASRRERVCEDG